MRFSRSTALAAVLVLTSAPVAGCGKVPADDGPGGAERPATSLVGGTTGPVRVVAVGDIACAPGATRTATTCRQADTARLTRSLRPDHVLALGDLQYETGSFVAFTRAYDRSWGPLKPRTKPLPGNHEYRTPRAAGYYRYFERRAPGYHAWNAGGWRIYNLDTNCAEVDCTRERAWLERDLAEHPRRCSLIAMHHPRFSSGSEHGNNAFVRSFWDVAYRHHVDLALAGHDHDYERFVRLTPGGRRAPDRGIQSFVSGAGGKSLYRQGTRVPGSVVFDGRHFGVLVLDLGERGWSWRYTTVGGTVRDSGSRRCV